MFFIIFYLEEADSNAESTTLLMERPEGIEIIWTIMKKQSVC